MKNSLRIHKWTHNEFNIFILGVLTHPLCFLVQPKSLSMLISKCFDHYFQFMLRFYIQG